MRSVTAPFAPLPALRASSAPRSSCSFLSWSPLGRCPVPAGQYEKGVTHATPSTAPDASNPMDHQAGQRQPLSRVPRWGCGLPWYNTSRNFPRFAAVYTQLRSLPRRIRRALQRQWRLPLAGIALMLALGQQPGLAATIPVGVACTLVDAITQPIPTPPRAGVQRAVGPTPSCYQRAARRH